VVRDAEGLLTVATAVEESALVGVDTETTGLDPRQDRVRLLSLATDRGLFLVDCFQVDPRPLWDALAERPLVLHNAPFDLAMLATLDFTPGTVHDTLLLSQLLYGTRKGRGFYGLAKTAERELGKKLDKDLQKSDWSGPLTREQLDYAGQDAVVLVPLSQALTAKVKAAQMEKVAEAERRCLPGMVWLSSAGMPFDGDGWQALAVEAERRAEQLARELDEAAPSRSGFLAMEGAWNWDSPPQVLAAFKEVGIELENADDDTLAGVNHPLADLVRQYRSAGKAAGTYGRAWLDKHVAADGRVYAGWRQLGCITGRMACSSPNLQNIPGGPYRHCFRAPPGRVLVKADYSQIELRIAAKVTGDPAMLDAYARGADLHRLTAQRMLGKQDVTDAERKLAKPVNFGLIYGLSAGTLRRKARAEYRLTLSEADAIRYRNAFFTHYHGVKAWHERIRRERATETRTLAGRRVLVDADGFYGGKANYVVQGTGGDGMKLALALLWERRHQCPDARPVAVVHDELLVECPEEQAEVVAAWLRGAMLDAMAPLIAPVPVEVEVKVARTWGGD
jgi:DNA polymerase-1